MNNYQIYEEIGKGRHSTVYKGRKKRSIEYYAIASIDKGQRARVLNSVHHIRALSHPNIVKFHNWYETNNHLWVITEYCTGGDLKSIVAVEDAFPETSCRVFAGDIVEGLAHLHAHGVVYADLKPSNILMDACATLRLYDFGLALHVDNAKADNRVGTPSYMAPELFLEGGVHSYQSDMWSLGCILYELATGRPPFVDTQLQGLIEKIVHEPHAKVETYSQAFNDLIDSLLNKDPLQRPTWAEVAASEFWATAPQKPTVPEKFPPQPAYDAYRKKQLETRKAPPTPASESKKKEDVLRASINAERNLAREAGGGVAKIGVDREVDFRDPPEGMQGQNSDQMERSGVFLEEDKQAPPTVHPTLPMVGGHSSSNTPAAQLELPSSYRKPSEEPDVLTVETVMSHPSDYAVKPIMMNPRIERIAEGKFDPAELSFPSHSLSQVKSMPPDQLEQFWQQVSRSLSEASSLVDKANTLCYLQTLTVDTQAANILIETSLPALWVKMLHMKSVPPNVKALLATIIGLMFRHAAVIPVDIQKTNIMLVLTSAMQDSTPRVRRRASACLGELLFYIATQPADAREAWQIPAEVPTALFDALSDTDEVTVHYAVRTVENISSLPDRGFAHHFATKDYVAKLILIFYNADSVIKSEHLRSSAICGALRLSTVDPLLIHIVTASLPPKRYGEIISSGLPRTVQSMLSFVNYLLSKAVAILLQTAGEQHLVRFVQWTSLPANETTFSGSVLSSQMVMETTQAMLRDAEKFMNGLNQAIEHNSAAVRGKACLLALFMTVVDPDFLTKLCDFKVLPSLERAGNDRDIYVVRASVLLSTSLRAFVGTAINTIAQCQPATVSSILTDLEVLLRLVEHPSLRMSLIQDERFFVDLGHCIRQLDQFSEVPKYQRELFSLVEIIVHDVDLTAKMHTHILASLGPPLTGLLKGGAEIDIRFVALKVVHDIASSLLNNPDIYNPAVNTPSVPMIHEFLFGILPLVDSLLDEAEPIPLYTVKFLSVCCDRSTTVLAQVARNTLVSKLLSFFDAENRNNNIYVMQTLLRVVQCGGEALILFGVKNGLIKKLTAAIRSIVASGGRSHRSINADSALNPCLEMIFFVLCGCIKSHNSMIVGECVEWVGLIGEALLPICLQHQSQEAAAECAASCVHLLSQLYPEEAAPTILSTNNIGILRELFTSGYEVLSNHLLTPLLSALAEAIKHCKKAGRTREVTQLQQNELFLIQLQGLAERFSSQEVNEVAFKCLELIQT